MLRGRERGRGERRQVELSVDALAAALAERTGAVLGDITARVAASQLCSVQTELVWENVRRLTAGERVAAVYPDAVLAARQAFDLLENGLGAYCS